MQVVSVTQEQAKSLIADFSALIDDDQVALEITFASLDGQEQTFTFVSSDYVERANVALISGWADED